MAEMAAQNTPQQAQTAAPPPAKPQGYGDNGENLPVELQNCLRELLKGLEEADLTARRLEVRKLLQRRLYFRGEQYMWWNEKQGIFVPPWEKPTADENEQEPAFQHVTNIFQATQLSLGAVLAQNRVPARFWPQDPHQPKDVSTAKNATKVVDLVHRNNRSNELADEASYLLAVDGFVGAYVRYVTDGERFGYDTEPVMEEVETEVAPEHAYCPQCDEQMPLDAAPFGVCPQCGGEVEIRPPEMALVPRQVGEKEVERGQEVITLYGAMNLRRSMKASEQSQFLYFTLLEDVHKAEICSLYPHLEEKLKSETGPLATDDAYEALARRLLLEGTTRASGTSGEKDLGVYRRSWIRPRAFYAIADKEKRAELMESFPKGCMVEFFGEAYCAARAEGLDEKWVTLHGMPGQGEGQIRETYMSAMIPIQDQTNDLANLHFETFMMGVPEGFADENAIDWQSRKQQGALPGNLSPVQGMTPNTDIRAKLMFSPAAEPSVASVQYRDTLLGPIREFISGDFPALHGGSDQGTDTASGLQLLRNQALGRIGRVWKRLQEFWARVDLLAVKCFAKNRSGAVEAAVLGDSGDFMGETLDPEELNGNVSAYPEVDRQYPILQTQIAGVLANLMGNEAVLPLIAGSPENLSYTLRELGVSELKVPGEDSRVKQLREIELLLQQQPMLAPGMDGIPVPMPSIAPDDVLDNHQVEEQAGIEWANSEAGQKARAENPPGFENVKLHIMAHQQMRKMKELQQAVVEQAVGGGGPANDLAGAEEIPEPKIDEGAANGSA